MNVLQQRMPLFRVDAWARGLPLELLWDGHVTAEAFNDDALGRVWEKLADHGPTVVATLGARIQALADAGPQVLHTDPTSFSLFGDYAHAAAGGATITWGYSKARRPDLKQIW
jgi:transposase